MNFYFKNILLFSLTFVSSFDYFDAHVSRAVDLYTHECVNNTCKYVLHVSNSDRDSSAPVHTGQELQPFKVLLGQLYNNVQKNAIKTAAVTKGLTASVISLTGEIFKLQKQYNYTDRAVTMLQKEADTLKHNVSSLLSGKWKDLQPIIVRPASPDQDAPKGFGVDCAALYRSGINSSGIYTIQPDPDDSDFRFGAFCDMEKDGGGWTVIQRRVEGSDDFFRGWESYKQGFGSLHHDFWLGLEKIHALTKFGNTNMRITLHDWEGKSRYSAFSYVRVSSETDSYRILAGKYSGNGGDPFHTQRYSDRMQSMRFSTFDNDNDLDPNGNCAATFTSGWWFNSCFLGNLNGVWYGNSTYVARSNNGIIWDLWGEHPRGYSLKSVEMKIRPDY